MRYRIHFRNIETGETKTYEDDYEWSDEAHMLFQYLHNNYSCDCNRSLFFYDRDESKELPCNGQENVIVIDHIEDADGKVVWNSKEVLSEL